MSEMKEQIGSSCEGTMVKTNSQTESDFVAELPAKEAQMLELPDEGELEAWRATATALRGHNPSRALLTRAAHLLENAYMLGCKLRATKPLGEAEEVCSAEGQGEAGA